METTDKEEIKDDIKSMSDAEFSKLHFTQNQVGNQIYIKRNGKDFFSIYLNYFNCCGMTEMHHPLLYADDDTKLMKRVVKYILKNKFSSLIISNFQKDNQKSNIDFFRSIGFKDITTYKNKNTDRNLVSLYYVNS